LTRQAKPHTVSHPAADLDVEPGSKTNEREPLFMLDPLSCATFEALRGQAFGLHVGAQGTAALELVEVEPLPLHAGMGHQPARTPFSLVFRGDKGAALPQRIYGIEHEALGRVEIFLVPIGPDPQGQRYEAVFN